jgi:dTDP-4-amino-4,6-dideoxygalactose transaminase
MKPNAQDSTETSESETRDTDYCPGQPVNPYLAHSPENLPVASANQSRILSLPIYPEMGDEMIAYVVAHIRSFFQESGDSSEKVVQLAKQRG